MKALLRELAARGRAILYSTHHLEVAERLCERVLILHEGRVVADDSVANLRELRRQPSLEAIFSTLGAGGPARGHGGADRAGGRRGAAAGGAVSPRRLLFRHFLRQLASFEATATGGEAKYVIIAVVSLLAGPGYLAAVGGRPREPRGSRCPTRAACPRSCGSGSRSGCCSRCPS